MRTALQNARVFNGQTITSPQTIILDGEYISDGEIADAKVVDCEGGILIPGLIDAHIHLHTEDDLKELTASGVTTGLDMATWPASKVDSLRNRPGLTDIRSAGLPVTRKGSIHSCLLPLPGEAFLTGPHDAPGFVAKRVEEGSDYIKIICDINGPTQETLNAIVFEAHQRQKFVVAHASNLIYEMALDAKADIITHAPLDMQLPEDLVQRIRSEARAIVPTLTMMKALSKPPPLSAALGLLWRPSLMWALFNLKRKSPSKQNDYSNARESVSAMHKAGIPILAGTDAHKEDNSYVEVRHGEALHRELELLVECGISNLDSLRAATILPAQHFGLSDRGVIQAGKRADLVLLSRDPLQDITATRAIRHVWIKGEMVS